MTTTNKRPPEGLRVLVLNQDYVPLNIVHWKKGMKRTFESPCLRCKQRGFVYVNGRKTTCKYCLGTGLLPPANVVEYFNEGYSVRDGRGHEHLIPAVIANSHHVTRIYRKVPFSRTNIFRRDNFTCQYCNKQMPPQDLTLDHVVPRRMWNGNGTPTCWKNIVACCLRCNRLKADQTPEQAGVILRKQVKDRMIEYKYPKQPTQQEISLGLTYRKIPDEWEKYVAPFMKSRPTG